MDDSLDNLPTIDPEFEPSAAELKAGQFLGENKNYRLKKNLGVGGMGEVWLAAEIRAGQEIRKVVVKTLRPDRRGNEGAQEKALEQFKLIQKLNHQNICPIYVIEKDSACGYLVVMGYAGGGSFADWFAGKPKPLAEVCKVLRPIADALDFAHSKGVIHRDVKPSNMMFTSDGVPWLIDFGIATRLRSESMATSGQFSSSGTDRYMAPEQRASELQTEQTDQYSLAMVALEFLTGSLSPLSLLEFTPRLQAILKKALAPEPTERYATCCNFIDELEVIEEVKPAVGITPPLGGALEHLFNVEDAALRQRLTALGEKIQTEYQSGHYEETITFLNAFLKLKPDDANAKLFLSRAIEKRKSQKKCRIKKNVFKKYKGKETEVVIPEGVKKIGKQAFDSCRYIMSVVIPKSVTEIGMHAFYECRALQSVVIHKGVTKIEFCAFYGCTSLTSVVIPEGVTEIGRRAFAGCSSLTSVVIPDSVEKIGDGAFACCPALKEWLISSNHPYFKSDGTGLLTKDGKTLIACLGTAGEYRIPEGVEQIGEAAFSGCSSLTSVVIPESVTKIGQRIGYWEVDCGLKKVERGAFSGCISLTSIIIPEGVREIGACVFYGCNSLKSIVIPNSLKSIEWGAFANCPSLNELSISSTHPYFEYEGSCLLCKESFYENRDKGLISYLGSAQTYEIPEGVTDVFPYAFYGRNSLTFLRIPRSVKDIEKNAFRNCPNLKIESPIFSYAWWHLVLPKWVLVLCGIALWYYCRKLFLPFIGLVLWVYLPEVFWILLFLILCITLSTAPKVFFTIIGIVALFYLLYFLNAYCNEYYVDK